MTEKTLFFIQVIGFLFTVVLSTLAILGYLNKLISLIRNMQASIKQVEERATNQRELLKQQLTYNESLHTVKLSSLETEIQCLKDKIDELGKRGNDHDGTHY